MHNANMFVERANLLLQQKRYKDAIKEAGFALQQNPEDEEALCIVAHCKIDLKLYDEAIAILQKCIHLNPNQDYLFYLLAFAYYQKDWFDKALQYLNNALALYPYNAGYFSLKGNIYIAKNKFEEALQASNEGLEVDAEDTSCLNCRSAALFKLKRKDEAIETIQEALAVNPEDYHTHANYGWHYLEKGKHKQAVEHFREALRNNPNYAYAKEGYKASLKANLAVYRWLLQYSLWMQNQNKFTRYALIFGLFILVRIVMAFGSKSGNTAVGIFVATIVLLYLLFILLSWLGNSIANLYLLLFKQGGYILTVTEKWSSRLVGICLGICILLFVLSFIVTDTLFIGCLLMIAFSVVLTELEFPIKFFKGSTRNILAQSILSCGILGLVSVLIHTEIALLFGFIGFILFVGFMWSSPFKS
jgi:tetratricopeptide (TPR) repeat protein